LATHYVAIKHGLREYAWPLRGFYLQLLLIQAHRYKPLKVILFSY